MKLDRKTLRLYAVTDRQWLADSTLAEEVEAAVKAGVTMVQLREKNLSFDEFVAAAKEIKLVTERFNVPLIINDNADVAIEAMADGVHVGQCDLDAHDARKKIGDGMILGVSVRTAEQALKAEKMGADYLGAGAVFSTSTKHDAETISHVTLKDICECVSIPVVAIGGISKDNVLELTGSGIAGIAVISAIFAESDISSAAGNMRMLADRAAADAPDERK